ncbi:MAG: tRNA-binding protein [Bacteroidetes bacterium]|nr:tRNA-binding protein [Bacteroidota bacterium]MDA1268841.1 tRNA-binding protein [Bacteroidota bacterium]
MQTIDLEDFKKINFRVGTVLRVEAFEKAHKPAYQVWVDLGSELGIKKSSAQLTLHYRPKDLVGKQVLCVCNFPPRQVADFMSEVLITGFTSADGGILIATSDQPVPNGAALH